MKIIETQTFKKLAASWDDQAGFTGSDGGTRYRRDQAGSLFLGDGVPDSQESIIKKWKKPKRKRRIERVEEMPKPSI